MHLNAIEPGWYEVKLILSYTYDNTEESVITDNAIVMYVPDQNEVVEAYVADDLENGVIKIFSDTTTLLQDLKTIREKKGCYYFSRKFTYKPYNTWGISSNSKSW